MYSGRIVHFRDLILRFRGQKHVFCRSGIDELRLSEQNVETN